MITNAFLDIHILAKVKNCIVQLKFPVSDLKSKQYWINMSMALISKGGMLELCLTDIYMYLKQWPAYILNNVTN